MTTLNMPDFDFKVPRGYRWLFESGVMTYLNSPLKPWVLLDRNPKYFTPSETRDELQRRIVSFARRSDCDDVACFRVNAQNEVEDIVLINGWGPNEGDQIVVTYESFWDWLKSVIDDISELIGDEKT